jgi:hypothetical protein
MLLAEELVLPCGLTLPNRLCKVCNYLLSFDVHN